MLPQKVYSNEAGAINGSVNEALIGRSRGELISNDSVMISRVVDS